MKISAHIINFFAIAILCVSSVLCLFQMIGALGYMYTYIADYLYFISGCILYVLLIRFVFKDILFCQVFIHELTHLIVGVFMLQKVESFYVGTTDGGWVKLRGSNNIFVDLAPYCLPIISYFLLLINLLFYPQLTWFYAIVGFFSAFHLHTFCKQIHIKQTDIIKNGVVKSIFFIVTFLLLNSIVIIYSVKMGLFEAIKVTLTNIMYYIIFLIN